ncbi:MAG: tetratricopeptide repeat protein [Anaerolineae bacterium]|nr:tetratricopeptide repeat protein [Anaerolineae bacterium]
MSVEIIFKPEVIPLLADKPTIENTLQDLFANNGYQSLSIEKALHRVRDQLLLLIAQGSNGDRYVVNLNLRNVQPAPTVENPKRLELPPGSRELLEAMFVGCGRLVIEEKFTEGFSGSEVFLAHPIQVTEKSEQSELPVVVKLAGHNLVQAEVKGFDGSIGRNIAEKAELVREPVLMLGEDLGGLCYSLVGGGFRETTSLRKYVPQAEVTAIEQVMQRLMTLVRPSAQYSRPFPKFHLRKGYDSLLPVNVLVSSETLPPDTTPFVIDAQLPPPDDKLKADTFVRLEGFMVIEIEAIDQGQRLEVTLDHPQAARDRALSYRVRIHVPNNQLDWEVGRIVSSIEGKILKTRHDQLTDEAANALGSTVDLNQAEYMWPDGLRLPNPIAALPKLLSASPNVRIGKIHGDFNVENILVLPELPDVRLIDFSEAREDHILHDFLRLETAIMTTLVAEFLDRYQLAVFPLVINFYQQLHWAMIHDNRFQPSPLDPALEKPLAMLMIIRRTATEFLFKPGDYREYYQGLALHMIGTLRYRNLNTVPEAPLPKQIAFWGAVAALAFADGILESYIPPCPYRGLEFFDVEHAAHFFGRETLTQRSLKKVDPALPSRPRFLAIVGPSGSGKSSLARAGVIASLRRGALPGSEQWHDVIFRPGADPLTSLAQALISVGQQSQPPVNIPDAAPSLLENERALTAIIQQLLSAQDNEQTFVILVDQFEELFTLCKDETERQALLNNLLYAAQTPETPIIVLITLRADFYGECATYPKLAQLLSEDHQTVVSPMSGNDLQRAIEAPARQTGCFFEPGLVEVIANDIQGRTGGLPLLQHALRELWDQQEEHCFSHAAYKKIGRATGALQQRAEAAFQTLTEAEEQLCRRLFLRLTQPSEGAKYTRRVAKRQEIEAGWPLVQHLAKARLVVTNRNAAGEETVEVVHEALIRSWSRLQTWLEEDHVFHIWQERLRAPLWEWETSQRDERNLLHGTLLDEAKNWLDNRADDLSDGERSFIESSIALQQREQQEQRRQQQRFIRTLMTGLTIAVAGLMLMMVLVGVAGFLYLQADAAANTALAQKLAAQALSLADSQPDLALLLGLEAERIAPESDSGSNEFRHSLLTGLTANPQLAVYIREHVGDVNTVAFSPNGRTLATGGDDATIVLWDIAANQRHARLIGHARWIEEVAFSPNDDNILASASGDGVVILWNIEKGQPLYRFTGHKDAVNAVVFSPDGKWLATAGKDQKIIIWDVKTGQQQQTLEEGHSDAIISLAFSPDGTILASGSRDTTIVLWDVTHGRKVDQRTEEHTDYVSSLAFSPDGTILASGDRDSKIILWDVAFQPYELHDPKILTGHTNNVLSLAFSPDGQTLASGSWDKTIRLWDVTTRQPLGQPLQGHRAAVTAVSFRPKGHFLASASADGTVILREMSKPSNLAYRPFEYKGEDELRSVAYSPDGQILAIGTADNKIILWDKGQLTELTGHTDSVRSVAFSPDGKLLASGSDDKTIILWDVEKQEQLTKLTRHTDSVRSVAFSPEDKKLLASGSNDKTIILWDVEKQEQLTELTGHTDWVRSVAFSPDGKLLASGSDDKTIILWDVEQQERVKELSGHENEVYSVAFSPEDGKLLASGSADNTVRIWNVETGQPFGQPLVDHGSWVTDVRFSPDGTILASASWDDHKVIFWDVASRQPLGRPLVDEVLAVQSMAFSPNGDTMVSVGSNGLVFGWLMGNDRWQAQACRLAGRNLTQAEWDRYLGDRPYELTCPETPLTLAEQFNRADVYNEQEQYDKAIEEYSKAIELDPQYVDAYNYRGIAYANSEQYEKAIVDYNTAIELNPKYRWSYFNRGNAYRGQELYDEAIADFKKAIELDPEYVDALNNLCWWGSLTGRVDEVFEYCERAVELAPNDGGRRDTRGVARALRRDYSGALEDFKFAVDWFRLNDDYETHLSKREAWIRILEADQNPFDEATLEDLRHE